MANYNLSLPAETIDELLLWLDDKQGIIIKQTDLLSGTGQSTTGTMTQKAITDALGTKADADSVYTKTETDNLLADKVDKVPDALTGEIPVFDGDGGLEGSNKLLSDLATKEDIAVLAGEAGLAEAVIDTDGAGTEQEFTFRKSGGDGGAYYRKIKGKTLAWNQLVGIPPYPQSRTIGGITITDNRDGSYTLSGTATERVNFHQFATPFGVITGHSYLIKGCPVGGSFSTYCISDGNRSYDNSSADIGNGWLLEAVDSSPISMRIRIESGTTINNLTFRPQLTDITLLGESITTAADFRALYPDAYYGYNAGKLKNNDAEAVETTGVNQWDEEWESGYIDSNGDDAPFASRIRSKNYTPIVNGQTYYIKSSYSVYPCYYDADKNYISQETVSGSREFTPPANAAFMRIWVYNLSTYNHDICINLSNAAINGQYFPYWKRTLQLNITTRKDSDGNVPFADGMKGAGSMEDEADEKGGIIKTRKIPLVGQEWTYDAYYGVFYTNTMFSNITTQELLALRCSAYATSRVAGATNADDKSCYIRGDSRIAIKDSAYNDADAFAAHINSLNAEVVFGLATPVPFTWAEPLNLGVKVDENGTERAVAPEGATTPSAPFVADTTYTMSVARMVEILKNL